MKKFLYFQDGNNDAYCYPLENFIGFQHAADTTLLMRFVSIVTGPGATTEIDTVTLTIASNKEKEAIADIIDLINDRPHANGLITIADNVNQVYASAHVTDVAGTLDS